VFNGTFSTNRLRRHLGPEDKTTHTHTFKQLNNAINQENYKHSSAWALWRQSPNHD